jgi:hypothetical protein
VRRRCSEDGAVSVTEGTSRLQLHFAEKEMGRLAHWAQRLLRPAVGPAEHSKSVLQHQIHGFM